MCTGKKEEGEFGLGESVVFQLTERLNESFCCVFFDNFFTSPLLLTKLTENLFYGISAVPQNLKLLSEKEKEK